MIFTIIKRETTRQHVPKDVIHDTSVWLFLLIDDCCLHAIIHLELQNRDIITILCL